MVSWHGSALPCRSSTQWQPEGFLLVLYVFLWRLALPRVVGVCSFQILILSISMTPFASCGALAYFAEKISSSFGHGFGLWGHPFRWTTCIVMMRFLFWWTACLFNAESRCPIPIWGFGFGLGLKRSRPDTTYFLVLNALASCRHNLFPWKILWYL